jgi:hypothetical protein
MRFDPWKCPHCGAAEDAVLERVQAFALLAEPDAAGEQADGDFTEVLWNSQKLEVDPQGRVTLRCPEEHSWSATWVNRRPQEQPVAGTIPDTYRHLLDTAQECLREFIEERADGEDLARMVSLFVDRDHAISVDESPAYLRGERVESRPAHGSPDEIAP